MLEQMQAPSNDRLQIFLLSVPQVLWAGRPVPIPRRHVRGLLYHLVAQRQPVSRAHLCLIFWPEFSETIARRNLTRSLTQLRSALPDPGILVVEGDRVELDWNKIWCDASEFRRLSSTELIDSVSLEAAVKLYQASFLSGFDLPDCPEFDDWVSEQRSALEGQHLENLSRLMGLYTARKDYSKAIAHAQNYLQIDNLAEEVHRRLMMYYACAGFRTKALRQYETCVTILEQELGADPLPETRAVYQAILDERLPTYQPETVEEVQPAWALGLSLDLPLVGRSAPLKALQAAYQRAQAGRSSVILISGEPGIGKSRLLHDFMKGAWGSSLVLFGAGQRGEQTVSYHPIVEALRTPLASTPLSLPPYWLAEIARFFPELKQIYPDLPRPYALKGEEARIRLFEALVQCLSALVTTSGTLLLCLDDLHWLDSTSLSWLVYMARQLLSKNSRIMVVGTYRSEDVVKVEELRDGLVRMGLLEEIRLEGLGEPEIIEILGYLFNHLPGKESFSRELRAATGGNPFFLLEMLRSLSEELAHSGDLSQLADFPLPDGIREAISRRLERLSPKSRQVLEAGAVIGPAFSFQLVRMTAGRNEFETADGLADLVRRQLILEETKGYHFCHDLLYRATVGAISPMRLQLLHSRAARALEKLQPEAITALAYHFKAGGDLTKALTYYQRAAHQAEGLFAWQEAVDHYSRMYQIVNELDPDCSRSERLVQRSDILKDLARLNHLQNRLSERDQNLEDLESLAVQSRYQHTRLQAMALRSFYLHQDGRYREAVTLTESALVLAEELQNEAMRGRLLAQLGFSLQFLGQPYRALSVLEKANGIADAKSDIELRGQILNRMGFIHSLFGRYQKALDCQRASYDCYQQLNDPYASARNLPQIGHLYVNLGRYDEAFQALGEILAFARKAGVRSDEAHAFMGLGGCHLCKGEYFLALGCFEQALAGFQNTRARHLIASVHASKGMVFYHLGNYVEGHASLERGLQTARSIGHRMRIAQALVQLSLAEIASQDYAPAREHVLEGIVLAKDTHSQEDLSAGLSVRARLERLEGDYELAHSLAIEAMAETQGLDLSPLEVLARTEAGLALLAARDTPQAQAVIQPAVLIAGAVHQRWMGMEEVLLASASISQRLGQAEAAQEYQRQAQEIIQSKAAAIPDPAMRQAFLAKFDHSPIHTL